MKDLKGTPISEGVGIGQIVIVQEKKDPEKKIAEYSKEKAKLDNALTVVEYILEKQIKTQKESHPDQAEILEAHLMILKDPELTNGMYELMQSENINASYAVLQAGNQMADIFRSMESDYFKERAADIMDISHRIIDVLEDRESVDLEALDKDTIIFAGELLPSQTVLLDKSVVKGIVTKYGGKTSHTAIIAKTMGIPMISGVKEALDMEYEGLDAIVAVEEGRVIVSPEESVVKEYRLKQEEIKKQAEFLKRYIGVKTTTSCGDPLEIAANIALPEDVATVKEYDAEGIGLFRSEFLYMDRQSAPSEQEQYEAYCKVLTAMGDKAVIIRTMDIGGDKEVPYLGIEKEENPFLGLRAVRYCLREPQLFKVQLRALLRAGLKGNLKIMIPMISTVDEVRRAKAIIEEVKEDLRKDQIAFDSDVPVGIMIEVPSAALMSDVLADEVDFFSVGTNDLIQYTMAVDRMNVTIGDLYSYYDPAVLRLLAIVAKNAKEKNTWLGMCGDVAGDRLLAPFLVALGFDELSVTPTRVLSLRHEIAEYPRENPELVEKVLAAHTVEDVLKVLQRS